ncbi:MAG: HAMP domain-containing protein [Candidatus Aminicenantes bacterium]|nr:HAMP domain-containing protein [Candidatus Aminicenantes bacterium]
MKFNWKPLHWSLRQKVIWHIIVIGAIAAILLAFLYFKTQKNIINTLNRQKSDIVASMIECNIKHHMQEGRAADVTVVLKRLADSRNIHMIRILDSNGRILNSSKEQEIGASVEEATKKKLKAWYKNGDSQSRFLVKPVSPSLSYLAIQNSEECFRCHSADKATNGILEISIEEKATITLYHQSQLRATIIALVSLVTLTFIIFRLFDKIINRPISNLKDNMKKVQNGNLSIRLKSLKNDEIGDLTQSFNIMVSNLKKAQQEIEELHRREMERAGHLAMMGELSAGLAHEIKNPIAGIKGALEVIAQRTEPSDPKKEIFSEILKQTDRIYKIVQDLLQYARPKEMDLKEADPLDFIRAAINLARTQTQDKVILFHFEQEREGLKIFCDESKMQEILLNLLINAIAAIEKQGDIFVRVFRENTNRLAITVSDNGRGIQKEHLSHVFNPFFTTRREGTGLGLSISQRIVEAHKGTLSVESEEGKGTVFTIRLPYAEKKKKPT